jgi:hypothetical protein
MLARIRGAIRTEDAMRVFQRVAYATLLGPRCGFFDGSGQLGTACQTEAAKSAAVPTNYPSSHQGGMKMRYRNQRFGPRQATNPAVTVN